MQTEIFISPSNLPIYSSVVINEKSDFHLFIKEVDLTEAFDALFISISDAKKRSLITKKSVSVPSNLFTVSCPFSLESCIKHRKLSLIRQ